MLKQCNTNPSRMVANNWLVFKSIINIMLLLLLLLLLLQKH